MWIDTIDNWIVCIGDRLEIFLNYCHTTALSGKYWLSDEKNKNDQLNLASASLPVNAECNQNRNPNFSSCSYLSLWLFAWQVSSFSSTTTKPDTKERLTTRAVMKTPTPAVPLAAKSPALAWKTSTIPTSTCQADSKPWKEDRMGWRQTGGPIQIMMPNLIESTKSGHYVFVYFRWILFYMSRNIFMMECKSLFVYSFIFFHISYQNLQGNN